MDIRAPTCEPMDIDLSTNFYNAMDLTSQQDNVIKRSRTPVEKFQTFTLDDLHNKMCENEKPSIGLKVDRYYKDQTKKLGNWLYVSLKYVLYTTLAVVLLSFVAFALEFKCGEINVDLLENSLGSRVHGQDLAVQKFMNALKSNDDSKLIVFYGGTGVGKTFTASLLLRLLSRTSNTYHFIMPFVAQKFKSKLMLGLILCETSTVVIDDLRINDTEIIDVVDELLQKSRNLKKKITIIFIYNCDNRYSNSGETCDEYLVPALKSHLSVFRDEELKKIFIKFHTLNEESLRKCIQYDVGVPLSKSKLMKMMKHFNVQQDGCKGVLQRSRYMNLVFKE